MSNSLSVTISTGSLLTLSIQICRDIEGYYRSFTGHGESVAKTARSVEKLSRSLRSLESTLRARCFRAEDEILVRQVADSMKPSDDAIDELRFVGFRPDSLWSKWMRALRRCRPLPP